MILHMKISARFLANPLFGSLRGPCGEGGGASKQASKQASKLANCVYLLTQAGYMDS